jgi:hypothetical protein
VTLRILPVVNLVLLVTAASVDGTVFEFEFPSHPESYGGTCDYSPTELEEAWFNRLSEKDRRTLQTTPDEKYPSTFQLAGHRDQFVSWWGIVRDIKRLPNGKGATLLIQNTYDDGQTDCNRQTVQIYGAGDFEANLTELPKDIIPLVLVRVYGVVTDERENRPVIKADYMRVWHWLQFNFMDFGEDHSNPEWKKRQNLPKDALIYDIISQAYYLERLGPTKEEWEQIKAYHRRLEGATREKPTPRKSANETITITPSPSP